MPTLPTVPTVPTIKSKHVAFDRTPLNDFIRFDHVTHRLSNCEDVHFMVHDFTYSLYVQVSFINMADLIHS